ncbi:hypothetical protein T08_794 [Trichinella sp. T8]|nr:hypothetical protein T08_794 [Trichinella sp. T8]
MHNGIIFFQAACRDCMTLTSCTEVEATEEHQETKTHKWEESQFHQLTNSAATLPRDRPVS